MTTYTAPQDIIRRIRSNWESGSDQATIEDAIAQVANTSAADVEIDADGDVYDGRRWLSARELAQLIIIMAALGYATDADRAEADAYLEPA
ncbi:MAG: hypothetical protein ACOC8E_08495 [Planctomycetota bacterium]